MALNDKNMDLIKQLNTLITDYDKLCAEGKKNICECAQPTPTPELVPICLRIPVVTSVEEDEKFEELKQKKQRRLLPYDLMPKEDPFDRNDNFYNFYNYSHYVKLLKEKENEDIEKACKCVKRKTRVKQCNSLKLKLACNENNKTVWCTKLAFPSCREQ